MGISACYIMKHVTEILMRIDQWLLCALPIPFKHVLSMVVLQYCVSKSQGYVILFSTLTVAKKYKAKMICV